MHDVDGVNAGYARLLFDEYLDNPESVSPEWRALFGSGDTDLLLTLPGLARLLDVRANVQPREQSGLLKEHPSLRSGGRNRLAVHQNVAGIRGVEAGEQIEQR